MHLTCPHCAQPLESDDDMQGFEVSCPKCGTRFHIPLSSDHPLRESQDKYDHLRSLVGMAPASMFDYRESVAWVVVFEVLQESVAKERDRHPEDERKTFMMAYTALMKWAAMRRVEITFPPDWWMGISPLLEREFSKQSWYHAETVDRIAESIATIPTDARGRYFGASSGPWLDAVLAASMAGLKLNYTYDLEFILTVSVSVKALLETIGKWGEKAHLLMD